MIKRSCILRNISASGAGILLHCIPKFLVGKEISLYLKITEPRKTIILKGKINRFDKVEGRRDIFELGIKYDKEKIPLEYKKILNEYYKKLETMAKQRM